MKHLQWAPALCLALLLSGWQSLFAQTRYVVAPSGLNLRAGSSASSERIATIEYGLAVQLRAGAPGQSLLIDNLKGQMVPVRFGSVEGYMFDGYLSQFPAPENGTKTEKYVYTLREFGFESPYEEHKYDMDGYYQFHEVFYLPQSSWQEAFLIAHRLYGLSEGIKFPKESREAETEIKNTVPDESAWIDALSVTRNPDGSISGMTYTWRGEGGGYFVTWVRDEKMSTRWQITYGVIGD